MLPFIKTINKDHEHVLNVSNKFEMKTMKDYHDLYIKFGFLPLGDVFGKFKNNSLTNYRLCLIHYLRLSDLRWDALLNTAEVALKLVSHTEMYLLFQKCMRGGVSFIFRNLLKPAISI